MSVSDIFFFPRRRSFIGRDTMAAEREEAEKGGGGGSRKRGGKERGSSYF